LLQCIVIKNAGIYVVNARSSVLIYSAVASQALSCDHTQWNPWKHRKRASLFHCL